MKLVLVMKNIFLSLYYSLKRFPFTLLLSAAAAVLSIVISEIGPSYSRAAETDKLTRAAMVLALGIPLSLCVKLALERSSRRKVGIKALSVVISAVITAAFLIFYYIFLLKDFKMVQMARYMAFSAAFWLAFLYLQHFYRGSMFERHVIRLFSRFLLTLVYSAVLYAGTSTILFTVGKLFQLNIQSKLYYYIWLVVIGFFTPGFFLAGIPVTGEVGNKSPDFPGALRVLLLYIIMPLSTAYMLILYAYFTKMAVTITWPHGVVAPLVLWYSAVGTGVIFLASPLKETDRWARLFIRWYCRLVLPALAVMFVSMGIRLRSYGITEGRYYGILLGLWVTGIMIYWNASSMRRNIILPVSLSIIAVLSVAGPWSAYSVSAYSQNLRFEAIAAKYGMIRDHRIVKPGTKISDADINELTAILSYFSINHELSELKPLPPGFTPQRAESVLGFAYQPDYPVPQATAYFSYNTSIPDKPVDIRGYDYLFSFGDYYQDITMKEGGIEARYLYKESILRIFYNDRVIYEKTFNTLIHDLNGKYGIKDPQQLSPEAMTFSDGNENVRVKLIIASAHGNVDKQTSRVSLDGIQFDMLLKLIQQQ